MLKKANERTNKKMWGKEQRKKKELESHNADQKTKTQNKAAHII